MHRVLVVGTGSIGNRHVRCLLSTGRADVGICEPCEERRVSVVAEYGIQEHFPSLDEALQKQWDAAVIATPADHHIKLAHQLADADIHLLIEKPLSTSLEGTKDLIDKVRERNLVGGVAYVYRVHPGSLWLRKALVEERFGKPVEMILVSGQHFPLYRPAYRDVYYASHDKGGGAIQDCLTHFINLGEYLLGPVERVLADADHLVLDGVSVEDTVHVLARHSDVMTSYALNQHQAPNETTITIVCERGTMRFELHENRIRWMREPGSSWNDDPLPDLDRDGWFRLQANAFLDAIEGKSQPVCSLEGGLETLHVILTILRMVGVREI